MHLYDQSYVHVFIGSIVGTCLYMFIVGTCMYMSNRKYMHLEFNNSKTYIFCDAIWNDHSCSFAAFSTSEISKTI